MFNEQISTTLHEKENNTVFDSTRYRMLLNDHLRNIYNQASKNLEETIFKKETVMKNVYREEINRKHSIVDSNVFYKTYFEILKFTNIIEKRVT